MSDTVSAPALGITPADLQLADWAQLMMGFFWRGLVYTLACMVAGAVVGGLGGGIVGAIMGAGGSSIPEIRAVTSIVGGILGFTAAVLGLRFYIHWLLISRFGTLRLTLVRAAAV